MLTVAIHACPGMILVDILTWNGIDLADCSLPTEL